MGKELGRPPGFRAPGSAPTRKTGKLFCTAVCNLTKSRGHCMFKGTQGCPQSTSDVLQRRTNEKRSLGNKIRYFPRTVSQASSPPSSWPPTPDFNPDADAISGAPTSERPPYLVSSCRPPPSGWFPPLSAGDFSARGRFAGAFGFCFAPRFCPAARDRGDKGALGRRPRRGARGPAQPGHARPRAQRRRVGGPRRTEKRSRR